MDEQSPQEEQEATLAGQQEQPASTQATVSRAAHLKPWWWQKGCPSPNPSGRPKEKHFRRAMQAYFDEHPEDFGAIIESAIKDAQHGRQAVQAREFARDTIDGPLETRIAGAEGEPLEIKVSIELRDAPQKETPK